MKELSSQIWAVIEKLPDLSSSTAAVYQGAKPYFLAMPELLADHLSQPLNLRTFGAAKLAFMAFAAQSEMYDMIAQTLKPEHFAELRASVNGVPFAENFSTAKGFADMLKLGARTTLNILTDMSTDPSLLLWMGNLTEEKYLLKLGVSQELIDKPDATIADVLRICPIAIFYNGNVSPFVT